MELFMCSRFYKAFCRRPSGVISPKLLPITTASNLTRHIVEELQCCTNYCLFIISFFYNITYICVYYLLTLTHCHMLTSHRMISPMSINKSWISLYDSHARCLSVLLILPNTIQQMERLNWPLEWSRELILHQYWSVLCVRVLSFTPVARLLYAESKCIFFDNCRVHIVLMTSEI